MKSFVFLILFFLVAIGQSAPIPATSSSSFLGADKWLFWSRHGFSIHAEKTLWRQTPVLKDKSIEVLYVAPHVEHGVQPSLSVRVDPLRRKTSLKRYVHRWKKDYFRFGFNILQAKEFRFKKEKVFLLDMVNLGTDRQLRQYIFLKDKQAVVITCRAHTASFQSIVSSCDKIVKNFSWTS